MNPLTIIIPAAVNNVSGVSEVHSSGKFFLCTSTTGAFRLFTSAGDEHDIAQNNSGFGDEQSAKFGKLTFYNDSAAPITVTFVASLTPIKRPDVNITSSVAVTSSLTNTLANCATETPNQFAKTVAAAGTPVPFAALPNTTFARTIIVLAQQTLAPVSKGGVANTGNVFVGMATGAGKQPLPILPGGQFVFQADTGGKFDLNNFWLDADNNGDGLAILFW